MILRRCVGLALATGIIVGCTTAPVPPAGTGATPTSPTTSTSTSPAPGGSSSPGGAVIASKPACDLVFKDEATAALGVEITVTDNFEQIADDGAGGLSDCLYKLHASGDIAPLEITLAIGDPYLADFEAMKQTGNVSGLSGVGDEALLRLSPVWGLDGPIGALFVKSSNAVLGLTLGIAGFGDGGSAILIGDGDRQREVLVGLAGIALTRLTAPAPAAANTCALISPEQAAGIIGVPLTSAEDVDNHDAWGAECHYRSGEDVELFISVNSRPSGRQKFEECRSGGITVLGVGDEAFYDVSTCTIVVGFRAIGNSLLVRSGETLLVVGEGGQLEYERAREVIVEVARLALQQLGLDPGVTPPPVAADALVHPCTLVTDAEVGAAVGVDIPTHYERSAVDGLGATCYFALAGSNLFPLYLSLGTGQIAVAGFSDNRTSAGFTPVDGLGDEALQSQLQTDSDQPLVSLYVRSGETVLELHLGGNGQSAETFKVLAPGTPAEQLEILRGLAQLILPRL